MSDGLRRGWLRDARWVASPNCDARPVGMAIDLVVVHAISLPPGEFGGPHVEQLFTNTLDDRAHDYFAGLEGLRVSAHFLIARDGALTQFVDVFARAWHAGASCWEGRSRCNDFSIGVELEGCDERPFEAAQYACLAALIESLYELLPALNSERLVGHSDVAPARKTDPGPYFDWARLRGGLSR
ncbi:MAG: 1,6-anhydro-N-acetylmuramyl-L-alanine amidase AmpD [Proteobacteria bacterium]|nr:1,6-anhydro-N-acetylmuramyl-L-alanine amidase AmpD [Pseudomonadota bacterium]